jgi:mitochondrial inner membrane protease subunit 1
MGILPQTPKKPSTHPPPSSTSLPRTLSTSLRNSLAPLRRLPLIIASLYASHALIRHYIIDIRGNQGASMLPTIPQKYSSSVVSRLHKRGRNIKLGDIVMFSSPAFANSLVGKRVTGLPGDLVCVEADGDAMPGEREGVPRMREVPEGHVWVVGDNMAMSRDSRSYGPVPMALIEGKELYVLRGPFDWRNVFSNQVRKVGMAEDQDQG